MIKYFEQYVKNDITKKTIVLSCNDSYFVNSFIENENVIMCTLYSNIIDSKTNLDLEYFKYCVEDEGIKEIIVIGHYGCKTAKHFDNNLMKEKTWKGALSILKQLSKKPFKTIDIKHNHKHFTWLYVIEKMINLYQLNNSLKKNNLVIKGLIIDEVKNYSINEIYIDKWY